MSAPITAYVTGADLYADMVRLGLAFADLQHEYVIEVWTEDRHPREALDAVLGILAATSPDARTLRTALEQTPPPVRDLFARAFWDSVTVRLDREGCTP
jgi:hypothetical protein